MKNMKSDLLDKVAKTIDTFLELVRSFPQERFNAIPFEGSWTAAQVTEHLWKGVSGIPQMLQEKVTETARKPDEKFGMIEEVFLDFSTKLKAPDFVLPSTEPLDREDLLDKWKQARQDLLELTSGPDLSLTSTVFELPGMGPFTRLEWIWFALCHIQRHTHQLKNIYRIVVEEAPVQPQ
jgi:hypothetical protein